MKPEDCKGCRYFLHYKGVFGRDTYVCYNPNLKPDWNNGEDFTIGTIKKCPKI